MPLPIPTAPVLPPTHTQYLQVQGDEASGYISYAYMTYLGTWAPDLGHALGVGVAMEEPLYQIIRGPKPLLALSARQDLRPSCTRPRTCRGVGWAIEGPRYQAGRRLPP